MSRNDEGVASGDGIETCSCKVGRSASRFGLGGLDAELIERWVGEESDSLRQLESYVNTKLVRAALEGTGESVLEGEASNYYRLLTDRDTSEGNRVEAERRLERKGVDVDRLRDSFVSHQTIHTHLRTCLDVSYDRNVDPQERLDNAETFLNSLQNRTERISEGTLEQLRETDAIDLEEFSVFVDLVINCEDCGRVMTVTDLFENGDCVCRSEN